MRVQVGSHGEYLDVVQIDPVSPNAVVAVFLHGFMSTRMGEKATHLRNRLVSRNLGFVAFDFRGHGDSSGTLRGLTGTRMLEDCHTVIEHCCRPGARMLLIGSSMGGWVASWYAALHPDRVGALMLIAPSFAFGQGFFETLNPAEAAQWAEDGVLTFSNEYGSADLGYELVRDMQKYRLSDLYARYRSPALICHGLADETVDYRQSLEFQQRCASTDVDVVLLKNGDHRLTAHKSELADWLLLYLEHRWFKD